MALIQLFRDLVSLLSTKTQETVNAVQTPAEVVTKDEDLPQTPGNMRISEKGYIYLASREGLSNQCYLDGGGVRTVGIGLTSSDIKDLRTWAWDKTITDKEAVDLFVAAVQKYADAVNKVLKVQITQAQFDALVSITYNIGTGDLNPNSKTYLEGGMAGSTFMKRINAGYAQSMIVSALKLWNKDNGVVVKGLTNRREAEGLLFTSGVYPDDEISRIKVSSVSHKPVYSGTVDITSYL